MTIVPDDQPDHGEHLVAQHCAKADAERGPRAPSSRVSEHEPDHVACSELERDVSDAENRIADAEGEPNRRKPEEARPSEGLR
jgi:hypothetical protein